jgi:hypothetical protein
MFGESISPLTENLIVISMVGAVSLMVIGILRVALLKSADAIAESESETGESKVENRKKKISAVMKILTLAVIAATCVTLLIFAFFINTGNQNKVSDSVKIPTAPLPADFKPPTKKEIAESNEKAVNRKSAEVDKKAVEENDKAMKNAVELFKKVK